MKLRLNKTIAIMLIVTGLIMASVASYLIEPAHANEKCPDGMYQIGWSKDDPKEIICRMIPTGCPLGDSIPMDLCNEKLKKIEEKTQQATDSYKPQDQTITPPSNVMK